MHLSKFQRTGNPTQYRKELIYADTFEKNNVAFSVNKAVLSYWEEQVSDYINQGLEVPLQDEHRNGNEFRKGKVLGVSAENNAEGKAALFATVEFDSEETAKKFENHQVSIYAPPSSKGYIYPLENVALTLDPVVPDLATFEAISMSLNKKESSMPLLIDLAKKIGLEVEDKVEEKDLFDKLVVAFSEKEKDETAIKELKEAHTVELSNKDKEIEELKGKIPTAPLALSKGMLGLVKERAEGKLDKLVDSGKITPAVKTKLEGSFCNDEQLAFSYSEDGSTTLFDGLIAALEDNEPVISFSEVTKHQAESDEPSGLVADAERRAAAAK